MLRGFLLLFFPFFISLPPNRRHARTYVKMQMDKELLPAALLHLSKVK